MRMMFSPLVVGRVKMRRHRIAGPCQPDQRASSSVSSTTFISRLRASVSCKPSRWQSGVWLGSYNNDTVRERGERKKRDNCG